MGMPSGDSPQKAQEFYNYLLSQTQISKHFQAMTGATPSGSCANSCTIPVPTP